MKCGRLIISGTETFQCASAATAYDAEGKQCCPGHARESLLEQNSALQRRLEEVERERDAIDVQLQQTQADYGAMEQRARTEEERANANRALQARAEQELAAERAAHKETRRAHAIDMGHARDSYELVCRERDRAVNMGLSVKDELLAERAAHEDTRRERDRYLAHANEGWGLANYRMRQWKRAEAALANAEAAIGDLRQRLIAAGLSNAREMAEWERDANAVTAATPGAGTEEPTR